MGPRSIAAASVRSVRSVLSGGGVGESLRASTESLHENSAEAGDVDSSTDGTTDSESESDSESVFIYSRVVQLPPTFFVKDLVSACQISAGVHVYGTHSGIVHLALPDSTPIRTVRNHRSSVLDIDTNNSEFVATASIDGTVVIVGVQDKEDHVQASFRRPVHAIALHPDYRNFRSYISGGTAGQVVLSERGWLKSRTDTVLSQTQSTILALQWVVPSRLVWCNEDGITIFNPETRTVLNRVARSPHSPRADLFRPRICTTPLPASTTNKRGAVSVCIAWAKAIYVVDLHTGELEKLVHCSGTLAGAVPFHNSTDQFVVLTVDSARPELKIVDSGSGLDSYEDELELNNGARLGVNDYHLALGDPSRLWIVSCGDAVIARERNARDHVDWLVEHEQFMDAFAAAKHPDAGLSKTDQRQLGLQAAQQLVDNQRWETAAHLLAEVLGDHSAEDRAEWLLWSNQFLAAGQHLVWGNVIPSIELNGVQDAVLDKALAESDISRLSTWVSSWPLFTYDARSLSAKLQNYIHHQKAEPSLTSSDLQLFQEVLANLWLKLDEYVKAAHTFVEINSPRAFDVVSHYHLWTEPEVENMLAAVLSSGDGDDGQGGFVDRLRELINCRAELTPLRVVKQLQKPNGDGDLLLFGYLTELGLVDETWLGEFADLMIRLYAKYDRQKLLGFLERFDTYDIDANIQLCREQQLDNELVYLLGAVGKPQESLEIMVEKLRDYDRAVSFARTQETETWDYLISYCSEHPGLVLALLKCVEVSPARVLSMVPESMRIPGLKTALCKVLNSQEVSLELSIGALEIVKSESLQWWQLLQALRLKGTAIDETQGEWTVPYLVNDERREKVETMGEVSTFSQKIIHLRRLFGL